MSVYRKPPIIRKRRYFPFSAEGDVTLSPDAAEAVSSVYGPVVILGSVTVTPLPAAGIGAVVTPTVVLGSMTITPTPAAGIGAVVNPEVYEGSILLTPAASSVVAGVYGPIVLEGGVTGDYLNIYSAALNTDFDGAAGSIVAWLKVFDTGVWSDSYGRYVVRIAVDNGNQVYLAKTSADGTLKWGYVAGGTAITTTKSGVTSTGWLHMAITWDKSADEVKFFLNGVKQGATQSGLGVWAGDLADDKCVIGAMDNTGDSVWYGYLAHVAVWDKVLSERQIQWASKENMG